MKDYHESELVKALIKGDLNAFEQLFNRYYKKIYYFAKGYLRNDVDAEDVVQDVFVKIWESRSDLKAHFSFNSFIYTVTYHSILKIFRSKGREKMHLDRYSAEIEEESNSTARAVDYNNVLDQIMGYLEQLPEKRKKIFIMSRFEGISNEEIASRMNISKKTVENHIHKVLKYLREQNKQFFLLLFIYLFLS